MWFLWIFVALPIIEIALFVQIGGEIGVWATLAWVILSAVLGMAIIRSQGVHAWNETQRNLNDLRDPSRPLANGALIMIAGFLLILPGFFTDILGILLLIPPFRSLLLKRMGKQVRTNVRVSGVYHRDPHRPPYADGVIDGEYVVEDEPRQNRPSTPPDLPAELPDEEPGPRGKSGWTRH